MVIQALYFDVCDVGKHIKKSKRKYTWRFSIDGKEHLLEFYNSVISGKKKIVHNGKKLFEGQSSVLSSSFQYPFSIDINMLNLVQHGETYELRINNQVFAHLYNQEKMKREFKWDHDEKPEKPSFEERDRGYSASNNSYGGYGSRDIDSGQNDKKFYDKNFSKQPQANTGWGSVNQAREAALKDNKKSSSQLEKKDIDDDDVGLASAFNKFEYQGGNPQGQKKNFDDYQNTYSSNNYQEPKKATKPTEVKKESMPSKPNNYGGNDFTDFTNFGNFSNNATANKQNEFGGFDNFSNFSKPPQPKQEYNKAPVTNTNINQSNARPQQSNTNSNLLDLMDGPVNATSTINNNTNQASNQNSNLLDIFTPPTNNNSNKGQYSGANTNTMGVDFGGNNQPQQQTQQKGQNQNSGFDMMTGQANSSNAQAMAKKSAIEQLESELVDLDLTTENSKNNKNNYDPYGNDGNYYNYPQNNSGGYGGYNQGGYGSQGYNYSNSNQTGYNQGGYGGYSYSDYNTQQGRQGYGNQGYGSMQSGYSNYPPQSGYSTNQTGYGNYSGQSDYNNQGGYGQQSGYQAGYGNQQSQSQSQSSYPNPDEINNTPFDF